MRTSTSLIFATMLLTVILVPSFMFHITLAQETEDESVTTDTLWDEDRIIEGNLTVENASTLTIRNCTLEATSILVKEGSTLVLENVTLNAVYLTGEGAEIEVRDSYTTIANGTYLSNGTLEALNSTFSGGLQGENSALEVLNCSFIDAYVGLAAYENSTLHGDGVDIYNCDIGIGMYAAEAILSNMSINDTTWGMYMYEAKAAISYSAFFDNGDGFRAITSNVSMYNVSITSNDGECNTGGCSSTARGYGLYLFSSIVVLEEVKLSSNIDGAYIADSILSLEQCQVNNNTLDGVFAEYSTVFSNTTTFGHNGYGLLSMDARIPWASDPASWGSNTFIGNEYAYAHNSRLEVRVNDSDENGVPSAKIVVEGQYNISGSLQSFQATRYTNIHGYVDILLESAAVWDNGTVTEYEYILKVNKEGFNATSPHNYTHNQSIDLTNNLVANIVLPVVYPDIYVGNITVQTTSDGNSLEIHVELVNLGDAAVLDIPLTVSVEPFSGSKTVLSEEEMSLMPGERLELVIPWGKPAVGNYTISIEADGENILEEENEGNNGVEKVFHVTEETTKSFPIHQMLGIVIVACGVLFLFFSLRRRKPGKETEDEGEPKMRMQI
ncbi:MAG: hypothetical protein KAT70_09580 [Thermoplasmata archaeon]|nr:hypothetical protein [Thermoplasmata archaeon]